MTARNSTRTRRDCFDAHKWPDKHGRLMLTCHVCKTQMDPVRQAWHADHIKRRAELPDDSPANVWPICVPCHLEKTKGDVSEIAKGKRNADRHYGIKRSNGFRRPEGFRFDWSTGRYVRDR